MLFIQEFIKNIKKKDQSVRTARNSRDNDSLSDMPPVREITAPVDSDQTIKSKRISSCNYDQWNKFDAGIDAYYF